MMQKAATQQAGTPGGRMLPARVFFRTPAAQLSARMEQDFFSSLMMENGTYKTTCRQRFADINPHLVKQLRACMTGTVRVMDVGISYGVGTLELHDELRAAGLDVSMVATDMLVDACLVRVLPGCHALFDGSGFPLRFDLPWGTMKPWVVAGDYRSGRFIFRKGINVTLTHRARRVLAHPDDPRITRVKLVSPRLLAMRDVSVRTDDISLYNSAFAGSFDLVRVANVFNRGYFSTEVLATMVAHARRYLAGAGSHLLVVRTHQDNHNHGTLFRLLESGRLEVLRRFGDGSEIEDLVLATAAREPGRTGVDA